MLGGLSIERPDGPSPSVAATSARRRLALLAVLAASGPRGVPRDKLLALFWPESDTDRARHSLDQALYSLKREFAEGLVLGREELSLNPAEITSDLVELRAAFARGDRAAAVELYTGPFLDGVFLSGAPDFERWADDERTALAREVEQALESLASEASARGDHHAAARWLERLAARNPRRTRVVVALMSELAATGERSKALRHAEVYQALVQDDPGVAPNPAVAALAEKIRREPWTSASAVQQTVVAPTPVPVTTTDAPAIAEDKTVHAPVRRSTVERLRLNTARAQRMAAGAVALTTLLAVSIAWMLWRRPALDERAMILIADFDNRTGDPMFDRSLDAALYAGLAQSAYVSIFPRARVQQTLTRMARTGPPAKLDEALAREVAEREGISALVAGSIDRLDTSYMVSLRLVDAKSGSAIAVDGRLAKGRGQVIQVIDDLVRRLRRDIGESAAQLAKHDRSLPRATTRSLEALRKYGEGVAASHAGDRGTAVELWEQAVALDSDFALAHAELGAAYYFGNNRPKGDAHFARALSQLDRLTDRERLIVRASAESWRGNREGAIEIRRSLLAEYPADPNAWFQIGYDYMRLGRAGEAIEAFRKHLQRDSTDAPAYVNLGALLSSSGDRGEGLKSYAKGFALQPSMLMTSNLNHEYGRALILAGRPHDARAVFDTILRGNFDQRAQGERSIALLAMYQGHYDEAIERFRKALLLSQRPQRELSEARNRLFLAWAEQEKGWKDSVTVELRAAHALFRKAYFEPTFLMYLGKALVLGKELPLAVEVLDTLRKRVQPNNTKDRSNMLVVAGEVELARGRADSAVRLLKTAYASDESPYVAESLARALVAAGDLRGAVRLCEDYGTNVAGWYGMEGQQFGARAFYAAAGVYERMKDTTAALGAYERFLAQRATADSDIVQVKDARDRILKLRLAKGTLVPANK